MKLLVDMNLSARWIESLNHAGIEAVHWSAVGPGSAHDSELMSFARTGGYVVLTHDLDFGTILAATAGEKPSVAQIRADDVRPEAIATIVRWTGITALGRRLTRARRCRW